MNKNDWMSIRTGDIVLVRDYPNPQYKEAHAAPTKTRFAVVIGNFRGGYATLPAHAIVTKGGKTEQPYYRLKENELRVPANIISDRSDIALKGVIKAHRFPLIRKEQMILKVGSLPLETKIQLIDIHETIKNRPIHVLEMEKENPYYAKFMGFFKEVTLAEKMQFMRDDRGNHQYEFVRNEEFRVKAIQLLEKRNHLHILSVQLEGDKGTFTHTFATKKSLQEIREDWKEPKKAKEWIREDVKFYALWKNPFLQLKPDPQPHPDKYQSLEKFREKSSVLER